MGYVHACTVTIIVNTVNQMKEKVPVLGEEGVVTGVVVEAEEEGAEANNAVESMARGGGAVQVLPKPLTRNSEIQLQISPLQRKLVPTSPFLHVSGIYFSCFLPQP